MRADRLADWLLPGLTARMSRPRFLTAMAVSSLAVEPFEDTVSKDGVSPAWLVLEWYYVEAMASLGETDGDALRRVPGIDKGRRARRDKIPMNADRYLKTPKVFGLHGVYRRLARHLDVVDDNLRLGEAGFRLLKTWAAEQGIPDFLDQDRGNGVAKTLDALREAVREALEVGQTARPPDWRGARFLIDYLSPQRIGRREASLIWELLLNPEAEPRGEVFSLVRDSEGRNGFRERWDERAFLGGLRPRTSPFLGLRLDAIEAYEGFCRLLQEAWNRLRHLATVSGLSPLTGDVASRDQRLTELAGALQVAIARAREGLVESPIAAEFEALAAAFGEVRTAAEVVEALWARHVYVQRQKPPEGKRPWFEPTSAGGLVIRPPYRLEDNPPPQDRFVHPYRVVAVGSFIDDLWGIS